MSQPTIRSLLDNGGRRRIRDRRFMVSVPMAHDRRTNWERRCGHDRRLRRIAGTIVSRRHGEGALSESIR